MISFKEDIHELKVSMKIVDKETSRKTQNHVLKKTRKWTILELQLVN